MKKVKLSKKECKKLFKEAYALAFENEQTTPPWNKIFKLWLKAAKNGHTRAQFYTGVCYDNGFGTKKTLKKLLTGILRQPIMA